MGKNPCSENHARAMALQTAAQEITRLENRNKAIGTTLPWAEGSARGLLEEELTLNKQGIAILRDALRSTAPDLEPSSINQQNLVEEIAKPRVDPVTGVKMNRKARRALFRDALLQRREATGAPISSPELQPSVAASAPPAPTPPTPPLPAMAEPLLKTASNLSSTLSVEIPPSMSSAGLSSRKDSMSTEYTEPRTLPTSPIHAVQVSSTATTPSHALQASSTASTPNHALCRKSSGLHLPPQPLVVQGPPGYTQAIMTAPQVPVQVQPNMVPVPAQPQQMVPMQMSVPQQQPMMMMAAPQQMPMTHQQGYPMQAQSPQGVPMQMVYVMPQGQS